jgi:flagellar basal body rod protein FlgC
MKDDHTGYSGATLQDMLEHLFTAYGIIQEHDLVLNEARLMESWDGSSPFETVINRVNQCIAYAAYAGNLSSPRQILSKVFHVVFQTGLFHITCREWKRLPATQKTYTNFKTHIVLAQQDNRNEQRTSKEAGYGLAAQAEKMEMITENFANFVTNERTSQALALVAANEEKLASDAANKIALQNSTNQYLQLAKKFDDAMAKMKLATTNPLRVTTLRDRKPSVDNGSYCWSHGFHVATVHTSASCQTPRPGHQVAATRQNTMGGNLQGKPPI